MRARNASVAAIAATAVVALMIQLAPSASAASPPATTTGSASAAQVATGTITPTIAVTGPLAGLVGPIVSSTLGLVWSAVQLVPNAVVNPLLASLVTPYSASNPTTNGTTTATVPNPCSAPTCYNATSVPASAGIVGLGAGLVQGWVQYDTSGAKPKITSTSVIGNQSLTVPVLGKSLLSLGQITATTSCTEAGTSTASAAVATSQILGGADNGGIDLQVNGGSTSIRFKNGSFQPLSALNTPVTLPLPGLSVTASQGSGGYLKVTVHLGLNDLLGMLGLPSLPVTLTSATVDLSLSIGSVAVVTNPATVAQAWGLEVGLDLAADLKLDLVGASAELSLPTGMTATGYGNIMDMRLGYASCTAGSTLPTPAASWIPPELT